LIQRPFQATVLICFRTEQQHFCPETLLLADVVNQALEMAQPLLEATGHGDVPMAVRALKAGASDFIEKPFNEQDLLDRIQKYLKDDHDFWQARQARGEATARFALLTPRELAVMELIAAGGNTKRIAGQLEIQGRTVDVHRFNIMRKVGVRTLAELLQFWSIAQQPPQKP
jgi:FixJ family two-component response regulator